MRPHLQAAVALLVAGCTAAPTPDRAGDLEAARALFARNIAAIQAKDRDAYLACYRADDELVRNGPGGPKLGFAELAAATSTVPATWPESLEAKDVQLHWLAPGVVYGSYAYRVVFSGAASEGISERLFVRRPEGWRVVVSTAFGGPASSDARLAELAFLTGAWASSEGGRTTEELWSTARAGSMLGSARTITDGKTVWFEQLRLEDTGSAIDLVVSPNGQPTVRFRLTESGGARAVFENPANDYPKRIIYRRDAAKLHARIEGDGGKFTEWTYSRQ